MMKKQLSIIPALLCLLAASLSAQTMAARISNCRVEGSVFKWDIEVCRTDDWGSVPGDDILGNCDFYFTVNAGAFTAAAPVVSDIHASLAGNGNYAFRSGRAALNTQAWIALDYDFYGGGGNWQPPLDTWECLYTASLAIDDAGAPDGLAWHSTLTGFSRGNMQPLTAVLSGGSESVRLRLKVFIEGAYGSGALSTALNSAGFLPAVSPYTDARNAGTVPAGVTDWIWVELRETGSGETVAGRSFFLKSDGTVVETDGSTLDLTVYGVGQGAYYIVVRHRNHMPVMSVTPVDMGP
ncbi:hypothetical protein JW948_11140 [bacterium]|nr:hypothetical protein [bacterium]